MVLMLFQFSNFIWLIVLLPLSFLLRRNLENFSNGSIKNSWTSFFIFSITSSATLWFSNCFIAAYSNKNEMLFNKVKFLSIFHQMTIRMVWKLSWHDLNTNKIYSIIMLWYREVKIFKQIKWFWEWNNFGKVLPNNNKDI